jgi:hypothetical protein
MDPAISTIDPDLHELNEKILHFNPLLGSWQNTPRGGVFLNDESGQVQNLLKKANSEEELAYIYKRQAKLDKALELFEKYENDRSLIQQAFIYRALRNPTKLLKITNKIKEQTWQSYFQAEYYGMIQDEVGKLKSLQLSYESNPSNLHSLLGLVHTIDSRLKLESLEAKVLDSNSPSAFAAFASKAYLLNDYSKALVFSGDAINRGFLQTSTFLIHANLHFDLRLSSGLDNLISMANQYGITELRAAIGLAGIQRELDGLEKSFYSPEHVHVIKSVELMNIQKAAYADFNSDLIHDGDASDYNGRYFSLDISTDINFSNYFIKLKEIYHKTFLKNANLLEYDFIWSDVSITTNSTRINNHLHTAGLNREYLYTAVTYPVVPNEINDNSIAGYLRVGPPVIPGFDIPTWKIEIKPSPDIVILFPSNYYHESITLPNQKTERVSINTDFARNLETSLKYS